MTSLGAISAITVQGDAAIAMPLEKRTRFEAGYHRLPDGTYTPIVFLNGTDGGVNLVSFVFDNGHISGGSSIGVNTPPRDTGSDEEIEGAYTYLAPYVSPAVRQAWANTWQAYQLARTLDARTNHGTTAGPALLSAWTAFITAHTALVASASHAGVVSYGPSRSNQDVIPKPVLFGIIGLVGGAIFLAIRKASK